jgi:hypothetical protein
MNTYYVMAIWVGMALLASVREGHGARSCRGSAEPHAVGEGGYLGLHCCQFG